MTSADTADESIEPLRDVERLTYFSDAVIAIIRTPALRKPGAREPRLVLGFATAGVFLFAFLLALVAPQAAPYALLLLIPSSQIASRRSRPANTRTGGPAG